MFLRRELLTEEIHNNWLNKMIETNKAKQFIIYVKEDNRPIGSIFLKDIDLEKQTAEYGNFIGEEDCLGKGYGSDAGRTLIKYAFEKLTNKKVSKVGIIYVEDNKTIDKTLTSEDMEYIDIYLHN